MGHGDVVLMPLAAAFTGHPFYVIVQNDGNNYPYVYDLLDDRPIFRRYVDEPQVGSRCRVFLSPIIVLKGCV